MRGSRCVCMCLGCDFVQALLRPKGSIKALLKREGDPLASTTLAFASYASCVLLLFFLRPVVVPDSCTPRRCPACDDALRRCSDARAPAADQIQVPRLLDHRQVPILLDRYVECACALRLIFCVCAQLFALAHKHIRMNAHKQTQKTETQHLE
jgi:hypothetical protein